MEERVISSYSTPVMVPVSPEMALIRIPRLNESVRCYGTSLGEFTIDGLRDCRSQEAHTADNIVRTTTD
jgi:hypothetical protein